MVSLTENEARTIEFLVRNFSKEYNINQLARELKISPGGMFKILKKLKLQNFLSEKKLGNNIFYKINYSSQDAIDACVFSLSQKNFLPYVMALARDLEKLKPKTKLVIVFGSVLYKGREARDIDVLLVFEKRNFKDIENLIDKLNKIMPKKIHTIYQTKQDLIENIRKKDKAILEEIKTGIILFGRDFLVEAIKNGQD